MWLPGKVQIAEGDVAGVVHSDAACGRVERWQRVQDRGPRKRPVAVGSHGNAARKGERQRLVDPLRSALEKDAVAYEALGGEGRQTMAAVG